MPMFECAVPFDTGETWCRRNFFSLDMNSIGDKPRVVSFQSPDDLAVKEAEASKTISQSGWGSEIPVIEVHVQLETPAANRGIVNVTIDAELEGELVACADVADACEAGTSG